MDIEQHLGIKLSVLISGLVGGIVSLTYETKISAARACLLIFSGASTASYLQPVASYYLNIPENFSAALGFVMGLASMRILDSILKLTEKYLNKVVQNANTSATTSSDSIFPTSSDSTREATEVENKSLTKQ